MASRIASSLAAACLLVAFAHPARASDEPSATRTKNLAQSLFDQARALMDKGRYADVCPRFGDSERLEPRRCKPSSISPSATRSSASSRSPTTRTKSSASLSPSNVTSARSSRAIALRACSASATMDVEGDRRAAGRGGASRWTRVPESAWDSDGR